MKKDLQGGLRNLGVEAVRFIERRDGAQDDSYVMAGKIFSLNGDEREEVILAHCGKQNEKAYISGDVFYSERAG